MRQSVGVLLCFGAVYSQFTGSAQFQSWQPSTTFPAAQPQTFPSFQPQTSSFTAQASFDVNTVGRLRPPVTSTSSQSIVSSQGFTPSAQSIASIRAAIESLYDQSKFRSFNMIISPPNEALMKQDPKKELKVHCDVIADYGTPQAQTYSNPNMGCGYKGSVGSLRFCFNERGQFSLDDCRKASIKIDVEYFGPGTDGRVAGVKRLLFHGMPADWSLMAERIAFYLLKSWGIAAPLSAHASLYLNGKNLGVHAFVQAVDDFFTQEHFGDDYNQGKGGLYKELWFNQVNMAGNITKMLKYGKNEDAFLRQVMAAIDAAPLTDEGARQVFNTYFDTQSLIDVTAANTVLGNTDDWRQRHNLFWYVRQDASGKKLVLIPWDYDRLNDPGAETRGALKGKAWWEPANPVECATPLVPIAEKGRQKAQGDFSKIAYWTDIFEQLPPDLDRPVNCDKITQLMALALGSQVRQRTRELAATVNAALIDSNFATWTAQIQSAVAVDPDGPGRSDMLNEQRLLKEFIVNAASRALTQANGAVSNGVTRGGALSSPASVTFNPQNRAKVGEVISSTFIPAPGVDVNKYVLPSSSSSSSFPPFSSSSSPSSSSTPAWSFTPRSTSTIPSYTPPSSTPSFASPTLGTSFSTSSFPSFPSSSSSRFATPSFPSSSFSQPAAFSSPSFSSTPTFSGSFSSGASFSPSFPSTASVPSRSFSSFSSFPTSSFSG